jgi:bleomycin hydrolase
MKNFGLMPEEAYSGKGRGETSHNHAEMDTILSRMMKTWVEQGVTELDERQNEVVKDILDHYYGPVPGEFMYKGRTYTAFSFAAQYLDLRPDDYIEITSYSHHPYYTKFVLEDKYNWTNDEYWNLPLADFSLITDMALDNGYTIGWDGDADDVYFDYAEGLAYMPEPIKDFPAARQTAFTDKTTELNHMMHIVGRTKDMGAKWYYIKNSWGKYSNPLGGFLWMREDYFKMRTLAIIVNKKAIPAGILHKLGI